MARKEPILTTEEKVTLAADKAMNLFSLVSDVLMTHANNYWLTYDGTLAAQVTQTYAGNAYMNLQRASFAYELIRLTALWDRATRDRISVPSIYKLIVGDEIRAEMKKRTFESWQVEPGSTMLTRIGFGFDGNMRRIDRLVAAIEKSQRLQSLRDHRDAFIAHNLKTTPTYKGPVYGQERRLLTSTMQVADMINVVLNNTSSAFRATEGMTTGYAGALWRRTRFNPVR